MNNQVYPQQYLENIFSSIILSQNKQVENKQMRGSVHLTQLVKNPKFHQLKQLQYFKLLLRRIQDSHIKQVLPLYVSKVYCKQLDHQNYIYIPEKSFEVLNVNLSQKISLTAGQTVQNNIKQMNKRVWFFRVSHQIHQILSQIIWLNIPVLNNFKLVDKLEIYQAAMIQDYPFNRVINRKGEQFVGIFYLIRGQLKLVNQSGNAVKVISSGHFIGMQQLKNQLDKYTATVVSASNQTRLLFFDIETLNAVRNSSEMILRQQFLVYDDNQIQGITIIQDLDKVRQRNQIREKKINKIPIKLNTFAKKCDDFMKDITKTDNGFNQYIKSKKILLQLRQTMTANKLKKRKRYEDQNQQSGKKSQILHIANDKLNTGLSSCRSELFKQNILRRLEMYKSFNNSQVNKMINEQISIGAFLKNKNIR